MMTKKCWLIFGVLLFPGLLDAAPLPKEDVKKEESPREILRKQLKIAVTADLRQKDISQSIAELKKLTEVNIGLDEVALMSMHISTIPGNIELRGKGMNINAKGLALDKILQQLTRQLGLTYVLLEDQVLITTNEAALFRQMQQQVSINFVSTPLSEALATIADKTGTRLVLDPTIAKNKDQPEVTLALTDVSLDTALRLILTMTKVQVVPVGKVLFFTDEEKVAALQKQTTLIPLPRGMNGQNIPMRKYSGSSPPGTGPGGPGDFGGGDGIGGVPGGAPVPQPQNENPFK